MYLTLYIEIISCAAGVVAAVASVICAIRTKSIKDQAISITQRLENQRLASLRNSLRAFKREIHSRISHYEEMDSRQQLNMIYESCNKIQRMMEDEEILLPSKVFPLIDKLFSILQEASLIIDPFFDDPKCDTGQIIDSLSDTVFSKEFDDLIDSIIEIVESTKS